MSEPYLIGAYGMFWDRASVDWRPGSGPQAWQLLGRINTNRPQVRVCDFRKAQGFYILFSDYRATYVGLARGSQGIGARLRRHETDRKDWSRFCWFSLDDVEAGSLDGWCQVRRRDALRGLSSELVLRECEALLITVLGPRNQNEMRFLHGQRWEQLREEDFLPGRIAKKVDSDGFTDGWLRSLSADE
jgi:hypothetical protein